MSFLNKAMGRNTIPQRASFMAGTLETLQQYSFYSEASVSLRHEIMEVADPVHIQEGTFFFQKGESVHSVCLIGAGSVRVYMIGDTGREVT